jgi:hypothetical protein
MHVRKSVLGLALLLGGAVALGAGMSADAQLNWSAMKGSERFEELHWLIGEWQGYGQFTSRITYVHKEYYYDVAGMFLIERTLDMFPPSEPSTEFEIHQDFTVFYRDTQTGALKAKGFYVEGFVWSSDLTVSDNGRTIIIEATEIDNAPEGMRSKITILREGDDEYRAIFELAMPGKEHEELEELVMMRVE